VKCRPPNNRDPQPDEIETCTPFLLEQIRLIDPRVIVTLGKFASLSRRLQRGSLRRF
jgi:DNA polymerase